MLLSLIVDRGQLAIAKIIIYCFLIIEARNVFQFTSLELNRAIIALHLTSEFC